MHWSQEAFEFGRWGGKEKGEARIKDQPIHSLLAEIEGVLSEPSLTHHPKQRNNNSKNTH